MQPKKCGYVIMQAARQTISVTFNPNSVFAQSFIDTMRKSKAFKINESPSMGDEFICSEESPYDPAYVAAIKESMEGNVTELSIERIKEMLHV